MKKILTIALGAMAISAVSASCKNSGNNGGEAEVKDTVTVAQAMDPAFDEEIAPEEGQEVWKSFGGTYFFWGDGEGFVVDFPLPQEGGCIKLSYKGEEYEATADENTGKIVAKDTLGHVVFKGYFYDGGNTVKGLFKGEPIEMGGSGD
jgi:hypothetical protein